MYRYAQNPCPPCGCPPICWLMDAIMWFGASKYFWMQLENWVFSYSDSWSELCFLERVFSLQVCTIMVVICTWASIATLSILD